MLKKEIELIKDDEIKDFIKDIILNKAPDNFFIRSASSSSKYHPDKCRGKYGLIYHTKSTVHIFIDLVRNTCINKEKLTRKEIDMGIGALIIHDVCKFDYDGKSKHTKFNHPLLLRVLIDDDVNEDTDKIIKAVESHMGQWCDPANYVDNNSADKLPLPKNKLEELVHMADYISSRRYINIEKVLKIK